jgi:PAS domain S-box-containing protein
MNGDPLAARILESLDWAILAVDPQGKIRFWNPAAAKLIGWSVKEAVGRPIAELLVPAAAGRDLSRAQAALEKGGRWSGELRLKAKNGSVVPLQASLSPLRQEGSAQAGFVAALTVADRTTETELARRELERRLLHTQKVARIGSWEWNPRSGEIFWSEQMFRIFGLEPAQVQPSFELARSLVHPEDAGRWEQDAARALQTGFAFGADYRVIRPDGEVIWVRNEAEIFRNADGQAAIVTGSVQDVTGFRQIMETLEQSSLECELIFDSVPALICLKDRQGRHLKVNQALAAFYGIPKARWIGKTVEEMLLDRADQTAEDQRVIHTGRPETGILEVLQASGGATAWALTDRIPYRNVRGEVIGLVGISALITELKLAQEAQERTLQELRYLNRFTMSAGRIQEQDRLCRLAARMVRSMIPKSYVVISFTDSSLGGPRVRAVAGMGRQAGIIQELLGREPTQVGSSLATMGDEARRMRKLFLSGSLERIPGGLQTVADGMLPRETCQALTERLGIQTVYSLGLALRQEIVGGLTILLPSGQDLRHASAIEAIGRHLSELLHRIQAEEAVRQSERLYQALLRRITNLREEQNSSISRELHDDLGQSLTALAMDISLLKQDTHVPEIAATIQDMQSIVNEMVGKVRNIASLLRPPALDSLGLLEALESLLVEIGKRSDAAVHFHANVQHLDLPEQHLLPLYRTIQEALTNCARHSRAGKISVSVRREKNSLRIIVQDNGVGFDCDQAQSAGALGIMGMREHMHSCGGEVTIRSARNKGTAVRIRIPCGPKA